MALIQRHSHYEHVFYYYYYVFVLQTKNAYVRYRGKSKYVGDFYKSNFDTLKSILRVRRFIIALFGDVE